MAGARGRDRKAGAACPPRRVAMLEGLLVDLVPYGKSAMEQDHKWWNNESILWAGMGGPIFVWKAGVEREPREWAESPEPHTGVPFVAQTKGGKPLGYFGINFINL